MSNKNDDAYRNGSGYYDRTAGEAITRVETRDEKRFKKFMRTLFALCELSGFHIESRIVVRDLKTNKIWE